tara:strand:+ start:8506 stop:9471 length:966 start_codon:yes stop_codon:yes gene_type:complete
MKEKILICGYGSIGKKFCNLIKSNWTNIDIALLRSKENKLNIRENNQLTFYSINDATNWKPNAAIICSPAPFHLSQATYIASKGIPLLIEKPLGIDSQLDHEWNELRKFSKSIPILIGYVLRHDSAYKTIKGWLKENKIGKTIEASFLCGSWLPLWRNDKNYKRTVSARSELGGGVLLELSHELDLINNLFGDFEIKSSIILNSDLLDIDVEDKVQVSALSESNVSINLSLDFCTQPPIRNIMIRGSEGRINWDIISGKLTYTDSLNREIINTYPTDPLIRLNNELEHFFNCYQKKINPIVTIEDGLTVLDYIRKIRSINK